MPQNPLVAFSTRGANGNPNFSNLGKSGDLLVGAAHGANYEPAYAGAVGLGGNSSGVTTSVGLAATYVGCCLSNPAGSGKNLSILRVSGGLIVAPATITSIYLAGGWAVGGITVHTTPLAPINGKIGSGIALVGLLDSACTLVGAGANAPALLASLGQCPDATHSPGFNVNLEGGIVVAPGGWVAFATNIAGPASGFEGFFQWEEAAI